jgi:pimeloyl-ACP methyl ester carboxylesterase
VYIAYQTVGNGPLDLVLVCYLLHIEHIWTWPVAASFLRRLATFSRLILFDRRGAGMSDHLIAKDQQVSIDAQMDDIRAVMDARGFERAVLLSIDQFSTASVFAATFPERTVGLVGYGAAARTAWAPDYPWRATPESWAEELAQAGLDWGSIDDARTGAEYIWPEASTTRTRSVIWRPSGVTRARPATRSRGGRSTGRRTFVRSSRRSASRRPSSTERAIPYFPASTRPTSPTTSLARS